MQHIHPRQRDRLLEERRARRTGDDTDLRPADMHRIAMTDSLIGVDIEPDQLVARVFLALDQRLAADEILGLRFQRHGKADAGLERIGLVREIIVGKDQPRLDAHHVERFEPHRLQPMFLARLPDRVEYGERILRVTEDLVAEFAGIAGARNDDRRAFEMADAADGEAEPFEFADRGLRRRRSR